MRIHGCHNEAAAAKIVNGGKKAPGRLELGPCYGAQTVIILMINQTVRYSNNVEIACG